jgi:hypothetical protein
MSSTIVSSQGTSFSLIPHNDQGELVEWANKVSVNVEDLFVFGDLTNPSDLIRLSEAISLFNQHGICADLSID